MTTADLTDVARRFPIPVVSGLVIVLCAALYYFHIDLLTDLEVKQNEVLDQRSQVDLNLVAGATLGDHIADMRAKLAALDDRVVQPSELANNMNYFYQLESSSGVTLIDLKQNVIADKPAPKNRLGGIGYAVSLSGTYAQIVGYFDEIENGPRFYRLRNFRLDRGRETGAGQPTITLSLNLELLGWQK